MRGGKDSTSLFRTHIFSLLLLPCRLSKSRLSYSLGWVLLLLLFLPIPIFTFTQQVTQHCLCGTYLPALSLRACLEYPEGRRGKSLFPSAQLAKTVHKKNPSFDLEGRYENPLSPRKKDPYPRLRPRTFFKKSSSALSSSSHKFPPTLFLKKKYFFSRSPTHFQRLLNLAEKCHGRTLKTFFPPSPFQQGEERREKITLFFFFVSTFESTHP